MDLQSSRCKRELKTLNAMVTIYCNDHHKTKGNLCSSCVTFLKYAKMRLQKCPFGEEKEACSKCEIHCYAKIERETSKAIMRYAGPKMLWRHPILTLLHFLDI